MDMQDDFLFKWILLGANGVGKSALALKCREFEPATELLYAQQWLISLKWLLPDLWQIVYDFCHTQSPTVGVEFFVKHIPLDGKQIKLFIWDTSGSQKFSPLYGAYLRGVNAVLFVYDVADEKSFTTSVTQWMALADIHSPQECRQVLVANKCDNVNGKRVITTEMGHKFASEHGMLYVECSTFLKDLHGRFDVLLREQIRALMQKPPINPIPLPILARFLRSHPRWPKNSLFPALFPRLEYPEKFYLEKFSSLESRSNLG
jgi:small GTP-binding protein